MGKRGPPVCAARDWHIQARMHAFAAQALRHDWQHRGGIAGTLARERSQKTGQRSFRRPDSGGNTLSRGAGAVAIVEPGPAGPQWPPTSANATVNLTSEDALATALPSRTRGGKSLDLCYETPCSSLMLTRDAVRQPGANGFSL